MGGIQGAIESVCCLSFMREYLHKRLDEVGEVDRWGCHMLILLVEVVYWAYVTWGGHRRGE